MDKSIIAGAFSMLLVVNQNGVAESLDLEPCINGSVSELGLFAHRQKKIFLMLSQNWP